MIVTETRRHLFQAQLCFGSSTGGGSSKSSPTQKSTINKGVNKGLGKTGGDIMDNMQKNGANMKFKDSLLGRAWNAMTKDPRSSKNFGH